MLKKKIPEKKRKRKEVIMNIEGQLNRSEQNV